MSRWTWSDVFECTTRSRRHNIGNVTVFWSPGNRRERVLKRSHALSLKPIFGFHHQAAAQLQEFALALQTGGERGDLRDAQKPPHDLGRPRTAAPAPAKIRCPVYPRDGKARAFARPATAGSPASEQVGGEDAQVEFRVPAEAEFRVDHADAAAGAQKAAREKVAVQDAVSRAVQIPLAEFRGDAPVLPILLELFAQPRRDQA